MREIILKKGIKTTKLLVYEDIDQMPVDVFQKANKYWMMSDHVGTTIDEIQERHLKKIAFVAKDEKRVLDAVSKLSNAISLILNETNVNSLAYACMIHSVDGVEVFDRSEEGLKKLLSELSRRGLTMGEVKKKTTGSLFTKIWSIISRSSSSRRSV